MKKSIRIIAALLLLVFCISACNLDGIIDTINGLDGGGGSSSLPEDIYTPLASLVRNPDSSSTLDNKKFTFAVYIGTETFEETFEGETKVYTYQLGYIEREYDTPIYLDMTDLDTTPASGSYAYVTGTVTGTVYWTEDNKQVEVLDFRVQSFESYQPNFSEPSSENLFETADGKVEFVGAHYSENSFDTVAVVYVKYTNTKADSAYKFNSLRTMLGEFDVDVSSELPYTTCSGSIFEPDEVYGGALKANDMNATTPSGKSQLYYFTITLELGAAEDDTIWFDVYDDEYNFTHSIGVFVEPDLETLGL